MLNRSEPDQVISVLSADDLTPNASSKTELANKDIITHGPAKTLVLAKPATQKSDSSIAEVLVNEYVNNGDKQSKKSYDSSASSTGRECLMVRLYRFVFSFRPTHLPTCLSSVDQVSLMNDRHSVEIRSRVGRLSTDYRPRGDRNFTDSRRHICIHKLYLDTVKASVTR